MKLEVWYRSLSAAPTLAVLFHALTTHAGGFALTFS